MEWLSEFEYERLRIPKPDMVIYLNVDVAVSQQRMNERYDGEADKKDIHERNVNYLKKFRENAEYCGQKMGWKVVECCAGGKMRSIEAIYKEIITLVTKIYDFSTDIYGNKDDKNRNK